MRRAARRDLVEPQIVDALRNAGVRVTIANIPGLCDLIGWYEPKGLLRLLECKAPDGKLTPLQIKRTKEGWPVAVVRSVADALAVFGIVN